MSEGVVREVLSGRGGGGAMLGGAGVATNSGGGGWGGGWGGGDSREWLAIAATAPLPLLGLSWALLVSRLHRRLWRPVDVFVAALLSAGIAKQALTLAFALLSLLLLPPDGGRPVAGAVDKEEQGDSVSPGMTEGGWSWDGAGVGQGSGGGSREEALCSAAVWGLTSAHALQAAALASLAADRALLALGSRPRRFRAAQARYHVCVLAVVSALVGAAGVFARGGTVAPQTVLDDDDPCLFLPHQLDTRFALFWICLHGGLLLSGAALVAMVTARLCCCLPSPRSWRRGAEDDSGCCEDDEDERALPVPSPCDTSTAASTASTTASGRCGSTTALYAAASAPSSGVGSKCGCAGGGTDVAMAFRWTEAPVRAVDLRAELRWPTVVSLMALYYLLNHLPVLGVTVLGTFAPWLLPRRWPLGTVVLWAGLAQDALLPLVLTVADSRFAGWAKRVYSGATSPASSPSSSDLRRQHQQQQQLRQQQLEQRRHQQQQHLLHQQLQQQLQERRRRLEMTLDSPLPKRTEHEPAYAITAVPTKCEKEERSFHIAPPWKQKNSVSVESLFQSKSDISQQMSPPYLHQTLTTSIPPVSGSTPNGSTIGSGGREGMKFPLTNGSLFTVGADGRYPVMRNYRRGTSSNSAGHIGRPGSNVLTNPRCDAILPLSTVRHGSSKLEEDSANKFGCPGQPPPPPRQRVPTVLDHQNVLHMQSEESDSEMEEEPIYATLSSLEEDCEEDPEGDDEEEEEEDEEDEEEEGVDDEEEEEEEDDDEDRPASPMSSCSVTTAANDDFEYRDAKGAFRSTALVTSVNSQSREEASNEDEDTEIEEVVFRLPERNVPSALGLYRLRLDELAECSSKEGSEDQSKAAQEGSGLIRSPHNFHRRRYRRVPPHSHASRRLGGVAGIVLSVDSLQTALARPDAVAYLDNGERMSGSVPDFKKVFVSEFI